MNIQIAKHIDYIDYHMGEEIISSGDKMRHSAFEWPATYKWSFDDFPGVKFVLKFTRGHRVFPPN
jgi:hypothetical protein